MAGLKKKIQKLLVFKIIPIYNRGKVWNLDPSSVTGWKKSVTKSNNQLIFIIVLWAVQLGHNLKQFSSYFILWPTISLYILVGSKKISQAFLLCWQWTQATTDLKKQHIWKTTDFIKQQISKTTHFRKKCISKQEI